MSGWLCWFNIATANNNLRDTIQSTNSKSLGGNGKHLHKECNESNQHGKPCKSCQPNKCAACTTAATATGRTAATGRSTATGSRTAGINAKCACCNNNTRHNHANNSTINPSSGRQNISSGLWDRVKFGNFKQANASSANSIERCTSLSTGIAL